MDPLAIIHWFEDNFDVVRAVAPCGLGIEILYESHVDGANWSAGYAFLEEGGFFPVGGLFGSGTAPEEALKAAYEKALPSVEKVKALLDKYGGLGVEDLEEGVNYTVVTFQGTGLHMADVVYAGPEKFPGGFMYKFPNVGSDSVLLLYPYQVSSVLRYVPEEER